MDWEYKIEYFRDRYKTLTQAIMTTREESKQIIFEPRGYANLNPNLTIRYRVEYLDKDMKVKEINYYDENGYCYETKIIR